MPAKLNTEFNYRYQVIGETVWEKIKTLKGFMEGRVRAAALEQVAEKKYQAKVAKLEHLRDTNAPKYEILELEAELIELESFRVTEKEAFELNRQEIEILENVLKDCYELAEPTRIPGYTDEQMFEVNAANEFTAMIGKEIYAEILATGHPSPAKIKNAMSNPMTWGTLQSIGLIPKESMMLEAGHNPLKIELIGVPVPQTAIENAQTEKKTTKKLKGKTKQSS